MLPRADFIVYDRSGRPSVVVEAKSKLGTDRDWATQFHRNLVAHGYGGDCDYFTLVTPDRLYVWNDRAGPAAPPTYELPARPALHEYFRRAGVSPESIDGRSFELIIEAWLNDLVHSFSPSTDEGGDLRDLGELVERVRGGRVEAEAA